MITGAIQTARNPACFAPFRAAPMPHTWLSTYELQFGSLLLQIDALVLMTCNCAANLCRIVSQPGLLVCEDALFGANGARSGVQRFVATPQTGVSDLTVAAAVARQLVEDIPHLGRLLVGVDLPRIAEVFTRQFGA